ncbi:hypothetical protein GIB67_027572 [Kingdonia uniflora]|uniref:Uncharacterized protein n=1 Tax=Kingdonia uniflora TaxID=39325 RepID=A0A7J7NLD7_9MAGN|nr:hypothetical protein GIB67_027572 [Kingdonia uniflora]
MLGCAQEPKFETTASAFEDASVTSNDKANKLTYELVRVERERCYFPASEYDVVAEGEHLLAEPKYEKGLVESALCFGFEHPQKRSSLDSFPGSIYSIDYSQIITDIGALAFNNTGEGRDEPRFEFFDGMLQGVNEEDFYGTNVISSAFDEYLLDSEFSEKVLSVYDGPCVGSRLENLGLVSQSEVQRECERGTTEMSELSTALIPVPDFDRRGFLLEKMTMCELQETYRSILGRETTVKDKPWLKRHIALGLQNLSELSSASYHLKGGMYPNGNERNNIFTTPKKMCHSLTNFPKTTFRKFRVKSGPMNLGGSSASLSEKRVRKPTRRYIEESPKSKLKSCSGRLEIPLTRQRIKDKRNRSQRQHVSKMSGEMLLLTRERLLGRSDIQAPSAQQKKRRHPKKSTSISGSDSDDDRQLSVVPVRKSYLELSSSESSDDTSDVSFTVRKSGKRESRRKTQKLWNLPEVIKLINGVSEYGVGRWTDIKNVLFVSSDHRTSVDLKDKWRNLLRASGSQSENRRKAEERHNNKLHIEREERRQELEAERQRRLDDFDRQHRALDELCLIVRELQQASARLGPHPQLEVPPIHLGAEGAPTAIPTGSIYLGVPVTEDSSDSTLCTSRHSTRRPARELLGERSAEHAPYPRPHHP